MILEMIQSCADQLISFFNIFGPVVGYSPQYFEMEKQKSVGSFSKFICIIMIIAHTLRLEFYILKPYHYSLFLQSFFMFFIQSALLYKFFQIAEYEKNLNENILDFSQKTEEEVAMIGKRSPLKLSSKDNAQNETMNTSQNEPVSSFLSEDSFHLDNMPQPKNLTKLFEKNKSKEMKLTESDKVLDNTNASFDDSDGQFPSLRERSGSKDKEEYLIQKPNHKGLNYKPKFKAIFVNTIAKLLLFLGSYLVVFLCINKVWFAEWTALISCSCEALLPIIQFNSNFQKKSVHSLSLSMILCWFVGDCVKLYFLVRKEQPLQFILSTITIVTFDFLILVQFKLYGQKKVKLDN
jgi:hypothetical protein